MPTGNTTTGTINWVNYDTTTGAASNTYVFNPITSSNIQFNYDDVIMLRLGERVGTVARTLEDCIGRLERNGISVKDALKSFEMFVDSLIEDKSVHSLEDAIFDEGDLYAFLLGCEEDKD